MNAPTTHRAMYRTIAICKRTPCHAHHRSSAASEDVKPRIHKIQTNTQHMSHACMHRTQHTHVHCTRHTNKRGTNSIYRHAKTRAIGECQCRRERMNGRIRRSTRRKITTRWKKNSELSCCWMVHSATSAHNLVCCCQEKFHLACDKQSVTNWWTKCAFALKHTKCDSEIEYRSPRRASRHYSVLRSILRGGGPKSHAKHTQTHGYAHT